MADGFIGLPTDGTGKKVDTTELTVGANTVERQRVGVTDPVDALGISRVLASSPTGAEYGQVVRPIATQAALTNRSGAITTGATSQVLAAANAHRRYLLVQNPTSATESLWIDFTSNAQVGSPSIELGPGATLTMEGNGFVSNEAVNVTAATTGHVFTAKEG